MKIIEYHMTLPIGTASVERSFSQMKLIKTRLRNRLSDLSLQVILLHLFMY